MTPEARADIAKLIPLLGSDVDGEALAALRAIDRKLMARALTFHDLAALVGGGALPAPPPRPATWPTDNPQRGEPLSTAIARAMAREIRTSARAMLLSPWEQGHLEVIVTRLDAGLALSKAADALLRELHAKVTAKRGAA